MQLTLARAPDWRWIGRWFALLVVGGALAIWNAEAVVSNLSYFVTGRLVAFDWWIFEESVSRIGTDTMYVWGESHPELSQEWQYAHRYAPLFAYAIAPFVWLGIEVWRVLQFAVLLLLPWKIAALTLLSFPFWMDWLSGNTLTFTAVAAFCALRGSRWAALAFFVMALLVPRPLVVPVLVWLAWKHPEWRVPGLVIAAVYAALTLATGDLRPFLDVMLRSVPDGYDFAYNWGPTRLIGAWWLPIGLALGAWLTWKGRVGLAGLAISPYVSPHYLLMLLVELAPTADSQRVRRAGGEPHPVHDDDRGHPVVGQVLAVDEDVLDRPGAGRSGS